MNSVLRILFTITVCTQSIISDPQLDGNQNNLRPRFFNGPLFGGNNWLNPGNNQRQSGYFQYPTNNDGWNNNARPTNNNNFRPQQYPGQGNTNDPQNPVPNPNPVFGSPWNQGQGAPGSSWNQNQGNPGSTWNQGQGNPGSSWGQGQGNPGSTWNQGQGTQDYPNSNYPGLNYGINGPNSGRYPQDFNYPNWSQPPQPPNNLNPVQFLNNTVTKPQKPVDSPKRPIGKPNRPASRPNRPVNRPTRPVQRPITEKPIDDDNEDEPVAIIGKPVIIPTTTLSPDQIFFRTDKIKETAEQKRCVQDCPTTSEYNPICGSDNVTYFNPGRFKCARDCGIKVFIMLRGRCTLDVPFQTQLK